MTIEEPSGLPTYRYFVGHEHEALRGSQTPLDLTEHFSAFATWTGGRYLT